MTDTKSPFRVPETSGGDEVVYYYNREVRLAKASDNARFAASRWNVNKRGLIKNFLGSPSLRLLFLMLIFFVMLGFVLDIVISRRDRASLDGYRLRLKAFYFEHSLYVNLDRTAGNRQAPEAVFDLELTAGAETRSQQWLAGDDQFSIQLPLAEKPATVQILVSGAHQQVKLVAMVE
ncbi:MAG: hypothetical protein A2087_14190 [Spirochaetes bacterium GWD1_61_31]|nr:MAG: hypothetical protein A2Y37_04075 [Spirochaetes bacterium GWB1_60_80]OHD30560.1 MAG: hypothetical protein A2004_05460 [Spirochaetes bacterium GWC1_61_12]OHD34827.1 MAG: hypothetical protein A2087_14190 [Spirochaetes bacterium GWD1_61_31]OHD46673.1 MAG: hypothetical protein A2Y35_11015 [Spirochaetes bacterium GWE1_60_18]OHD61549.1 MAG: hypothetical protein A2Y32_09575 [Spirochaetes bacterium GWF1_60_12]HAP44198.1 hypothetical protein [Spirochaetaceae bacterium]